MTEPSVNPEDIQRKLEEIRSRIRQEVTRPEAGAIRNLAVGLAAALAAAYLVGKSRGKRAARR